MKAKQLAEKVNEIASLSPDAKVVMNYYGHERMLSTIYLNDANELIIGTQDMPRQYDRELDDSGRIPLRQSDRTLAEEIRSHMTSSVDVRKKLTKLEQKQEARNLQLKKLNAEIKELEEAMARRSE